MKSNQKKLFSSILLVSILIIGALFYLLAFNSLFQRTGTFSLSEFNKNLPAKYKTPKMTANTRPSDWGWLQRVFPHGNADKRAHIEAIKQAQQMRAASAELVHSNNRTTDHLRAIQWDFAGPENIGGRITDIEYDPLNPLIVYAGIATGGVFKSQDGGWTWQAIFDDQAMLSVGDIEVDPVNTNIIYVGTGEANGGHNNFPGGGVYKSIDAGNTWELIGLEQTVSIGRIVIDPTNTSRVFVAAVGSYFGPDPDRGVYRSTDAGATWEKSLFISDSTGAIDIIINPQEPTKMLAAMWERVRGPHTSHLYGYTSGIYRTTNGGDSWTLLNASNGLPEGEEHIGRIGLTLCQTQPDIMYALYTDGYDYKSSYKSIDGGINWILIDADRDISRGTSGFSWYFGNIRVHPTNPQRVYALDVKLMRSDDGGNNWSIIGNAYRDFHVDHHALAFHPTNPDTIIDGNDGGINISTDGGTSWTKVSLLPVTQFYEIAMDFTNPERLYGGTQDNGTLRTLTGQTNDWDRIYGGDGFFCIVDYTDPDIIYAESQWGNLGKSTNGGYSFNWALSGVNSSEPTNWSTPVIMDPNNHNVLYYGTNRVYRTENAAGYWQSTSPDLTKQLADSRLGTVTTIAVAPGNSNIIYAGTDDGNVWITDNYGTNWSNITNDLPFRWVTRVAVDPTDAAIAYVTFSGMKWKSPQPHVFRTQNMGETWEDISSNLPDAPVNIILVDPVYPEILYVGSDVGCYFSSNYGQSWQVLGTGVPVVPVYSMAIHKTLRRLAIGTHGRSMYAANLTGLIPVGLSSFKVRQFENGIVLNWKTESESNNLGFYIYRKMAGSDFKQIDFVKGAGTTTVPQQYGFVDKNLAAGKHYYRLKQVDYDGSFSYSETVKIEITAPYNFALSQNFPNPFNSSTMFKYQIKKNVWVSINIFNEMGQLIKTLVKEEKLPGSYDITWNGQDEVGISVSSGIYFCQMKTEGFSSVKRVLYLK